jgi:polyhydroxyalkanoate synthase subunit PhaC
MTLTPAESAPAGPETRIAAGHVGMVVGSAREQLHEALEPFLGGACR